MSCSTSGQRCKALLVRCSNQVWRGGPKLLLQIIAFVLTILLIVGMFPSHLQDGYKTVLSWSHPLESLDKDLRVVVFGCQDLAGSSIQETAGFERTSWTRRLCKELNCTSYLSFVPESSAGPALVDNAIYAGQLNQVEELDKELDVMEHPAQDIKYIREQYPVHYEVADLDRQINQFLSMKPPEGNIPRQTLWIFTFGTWDIWNMAAFGRRAGEAHVDALVSHLFSRVERLYLKSLNPSSVAFSDFWSNASDEEIRNLTIPNASPPIDVRKLETFRIMIPEVFDISLTPTWHMRQDPPLPHSRAEQMRNAAYLTQRWNTRMAAELRKWQEKGQLQPEMIDEEGIDHIAATPTNNALLKYQGHSLGPTKSTQNDSIKSIVYAPYPKRAGIQSASIAPILNTLTEEEMRRSGVHDGNGRGGQPATASMRFLDVWTPCLPSEMKVGKEQQVDDDGQCNVPSDHLFYDRETLNQRAIDTIAKAAAKMVQEKLFAPMRRRRWLT